MPAAFYIVPYLRHLHIQDCDRLVPVMPALLLIYTAINYSCNNKACSIKMWWCKCFTTCFSRLSVHFALLPLLTLFHAICTACLCPQLLGWSRHIHCTVCVFARLQQPLCPFSKFGTCWPIFLLLRPLFFNTIHMIFFPLLPKDYWE